MNIEANYDEVICPNCVTQFRAIPVNVQDELRGLEAANKELLEALKRIARPHDCGCVPCHGACQCPEAEEITSSGMRDIADAAIARATKGENT